MGGRIILGRRQLIPLVRGQQLMVPRPRQIIRLLVGVQMKPRHLVRHPRQLTQRRQEIKLFMRNGQKTQSVCPHPTSQKRTMAVR